MDEKVPASPEPQMDEQQQYQANLEALLTARTEQLRKALTFIEELVAALKPFRPDLAQKAVEKGFAADELNPPMFGGKPGEPVPEVDPEDLKTVWKINRDIQARHPGQQVATGRGVFEHACKPGADIQAVGYRAAMLSMLIHLASNLENPIKELGPWLKEDQLEDVVFTAAAKIPVEWMGRGIVRHGPPLDVKEFVRLCGRQADNKL